MEQIQFPVIKFMNNDKFIASLEEVFFGDKKSLNIDSIYNCNFEIIDSNGHRFLIRNLLKDKFSFYLSIKYIGYLYKLIPEYEYIDEVSLETLKERVYSHVQKNKSFWGSINDGRGLKRMIYETENFKELILMFV